jgi:hypothetical protein
MRVSSRGTPSDHGARRGRQAPRSGRHGAVPDEATRVRAGRPGDRIAVARELAKRKVAR